MMGGGLGRLVFVVSLVAAAECEMLGASSSAPLDRTTAHTPSAVAQSSTTNRHQQHPVPRLWDAFICGGEPFSVTFKREYAGWALVVWKPLLMLLKNCRLGDVCPPHKVALSSCPGLGPSTTLRRSKVILFGM